MKMMELKQFERVYLIFLILMLILVFALSQTANSDAVEPTIENTYTKFQDKYSMDWSDVDEMYLLKIATFKGGTVEDRAYNILVTLNRVCDGNYGDSIIAVVTDELYGVYGLSPHDIDNIVSDKESEEAMELIKNNKFDNSYGSFVYKN